MNSNNRPQISIYIAASIDGYIARKDNSLDWLDRVGGFDEDYGFKKLLDSIDTHSSYKSPPYAPIVAFLSDTRGGYRSLRFPIA